MSVAGLRQQPRRILSFSKKPGPRKSYVTSFYSPRSSPFYPTSATMNGQAVHLPGSAAYHVPTAAQLTQLKPWGMTTTNFGPCFECGMPGHVRKYCPKLSAGKFGSAANK